MDGFNTKYIVFTHNGTYFKKCFLHGFCLITAAEHKIAQRPDNQSQNLQLCPKGHDIHNLSNWVFASQCPNSTSCHLPENQTLDPKLPTPHNCPSLLFGRGRWKNQVHYSLARLYVLHESTSRAGCNKELVSPPKCLDPPKRVSIWAPSHERTVFRQFDSESTCPTECSVSPGAT